MQILAFARHELLHERHAEALRNASFDLTFDEGRVDRAAHVMGGRELQDFDGAKLEIDLNFGEVCAEPEDGVGDALAIFIERLGGRIERDFGAQDVTAFIERKFAQINVVVN